MSFKKWLQGQNRGRLSEMADSDDFPNGEEFKPVSEYVKESEPGKWTKVLGTFLDYQAEQVERHRK
jgi:hypothetical protein